MRLKSDRTKGNIKMSTVIFAWELGMGSGHVLGFLPIAQELQTRGHNVTFIFKDLSRAEVMLGKYDFQYLQAPMWISRPAKNKPIMNYADILANYGFLDKTGLQGLVNAWQTLFSLLKPDLIIMDHAPTALLASKGLNVPCALLGTGFFSPPQEYPMPSFRSWLEVNKQSLIDSELQVLSVINKVIDNSNNAKKLTQLSDLFEVEENFMCTFKELDHYPGRENSYYRGPRFSLTEGTEPRWPLGNGKRIFVYMYLHYHDFETVVKSLHSLDISAIVYVPGIPYQLINRYQSANVAIVPDTINMGKVREQCDACICHAGHGTVAAMLLAGKPLLMLPMHIEQLIVARNVNTMGAGLYIDMNTKSANSKKMLKRLLKEDTFTIKARQFSERHNSFDHNEQTKLIADRCTALMED